MVGVSMATKTLMRALFALACVPAAALAQPTYDIDVPALAPNDPGYGYDSQAAPFPPIAAIQWRQDPFSLPPVEIVQNVPINQNIALASFSGPSVVTFAAVNPWGPPGPRGATVQISWAGTCRTYDAGPPERAVFDTEMYQMDIVGGQLPNNVRFREAPARPSTGETRVLDLGGGVWQVMSFFDIWVEISDDSGATWTQTASPVRFTIIAPVPPPCDPDVNCDGSVNGFDIEATEQAINGDYSNYCQGSADLNGDGAENGFDIETEEQRVNGAPC
ncbi:hypothetical protein PHYC_02323 [Phycisphaerales bacterium]|nr:hypothetical protein PHYC_02323 [Phycisphaerales bacterium]